MPNDKKVELEQAKIIYQQSFIILVDSDILWV